MMVFFWEVIDELVAKTKRLEEEVVMWVDILGSDDF